MKSLDRIKNKKKIIHIDDEWIQQQIDECEEKNLNGQTYNYPIENDSTYQVVVGVKRL